MPFVLGEIEYGHEKTKIRLVVDQIPSGYHIQVEDMEGSYCGSYEIRPPLSHSEPFVPSQDSSLNIPQRNSSTSNRLFSFEKIRSALSVGNIESGDKMEEISQDKKLISRYKPVSFDINIKTGPTRISLTDTFGRILQSVNINPKPEPDTLYFVSCDHPEADTSESLWRTLYQDLRPNSICLHLGDNIYGDKAYKEAEANPDIDPIIFYRDCYRKTWFNTDKKLVLGSVSNLMNMDDHEIRNDTLIDTSDPICEGAIKAFNEYQTSLLISRNKLSKYSWYVRKGNILIISIERTSKGVPSYLKLSSMIKKAVEAEPDVDALIITTGWAMIPAPDGNFKSQIYHSIFGSHKFIDLSYLSQFYNFLLELSQENEYDINIVGGDLHFGIRGIIKSSVYPDIEIKVMVSSAITNHPTIDRKLASKAFKDQTIAIDHEINFQVKETKGKRCYAKLHIFHDDQIITEPELVFSKKNNPRSYAKYYQSMYDMK